MLIDTAQLRRVEWRRTVTADTNEVLPLRHGLTRWEMVLDVQCPVGSSVVTLRLRLNPRIERLLSLPLCGVSAQLNVYEIANCDWNARSDY